jgi:hypothetical protein
VDSDPDAPHASERDLLDIDGLVRYQIDVDRSIEAPGVLCAMAVAGVDACTGRWIAILLDSRGRFSGAQARTGIAELAETLPALASERHENLDVVAIEILIGLPDAGYRRADLKVRESLGARRSSLFQLRLARPWRRQTSRAPTGSTAT